MVRDAGGSLVCSGWSADNSYASACHCQQFWNVLLLGNGEAETSKKKKEAHSSCSSGKLTYIL
jgi:hypothetical protein